MNLKDFIKWYESVYGRSTMNVNKLYQSATYIAGLADAGSNKDSRSLLRDISIDLARAANLVECMNRKSKEPVDKD